MKIPSECLLDRGSDSSSMLLSSLRKKKKGKENKRGEKVKAAGLHPDLTSDVVKLAALIMHLLAFSSFFFLQTKSNIPLEETLI